MFNHHFLLLCCQIGTDVQAAAAGKPAEFRQPYILALGHPRKPQQYFLIVDRIPIEAGWNVVEATDRLFKCHYLFGVNFSVVINNFWEFIASEIFKVMQATETKASTRSLALAVRNVKLAEQ